MRIDAYDLDYLRGIIRNLQKENNRLRKLLNEKNKDEETVMPAGYLDESVYSDEEYDPDQGGRIVEQIIDKNLASKFFARFWGRMDVYARRGKNGGYYPQCYNRWNDSVCPKRNHEKKFCGECEFKNWIPVKPDAIVKHLQGNHPDGADAIGVYPLFPNGTCRFIVFDFDNHEKGSEATDFANENRDWMDEVDALRLICRENGIDGLVERSRSGKGAHFWILFAKPVDAAMARQFGFLLLERGTQKINMKSFRFYDRMYPSQDTAKTIGNLIALPLQGKPLREGNTAFVDENWNAYPDQWGKLFSTKRLLPDEIRHFIAAWKNEFPFESDNHMFDRSRVKPWNRNEEFRADDVQGIFHIIQADGIYIDTLNLAPRIQNQIRRMASFDNPKYQENKRMGFSTYYMYSTIYMGKDENGYIKIPRGLLESIVNKCVTARIKYDIDDQRETGRPLRVRFKGELRLQQQLAADQMLSYDNGILSAATAFGKTVLSSYLISERKCSTLILLESTDLIEQWIEELEKFLEIDENPPEYRTKTGRIKKRDSVFGMLKAGKDTLTGIIDIAMIGSLYKKGKFHKKLNSYGMVIMDECHHAASLTAQSILTRVNAKYVYGVSATPMRGDRLERINYLLLGDIRHRFTAKERAEEQCIEHLVYPRFTRLIETEPIRTINEAYALVSENEDRNRFIASDIKKCVESGRTPVVLTSHKIHAKAIYEKVRNYADRVFLYYGDNTSKQNHEIRKEMDNISDNESMILVATGQKIGEGFNMPRLDTLMLAAPVSGAGRLEQYVGRINRDYPGKEDVIIYDYIDHHVKWFGAMYAKRLRTYKKIGFSVSSLHGGKQDANAIFGTGNYIETFMRDIVEAEKEIIISSPHITSEKIRRFNEVVKERIEAGVIVSVEVQDPSDDVFDDCVDIDEIISEMRKLAINVTVSKDVEECCAVIDGILVWHGGMNLLGKEDYWNNMIRVKDAGAAAELKEILLCEEEDYK